jgi:hypothetical protein
MERSPRTQTARQANATGARRKPPLEVTELTGRLALAAYARAADAGWLSDGLGPTLAISLLSIAGAMEGADIFGHVRAVAAWLAGSGGGARVDPGAAGDFLRAAAQGFIACGNHQLGADALELRNALTVRG